MVGEDSQTYMWVKDIVCRIVLQRKFVGEVLQRKLEEDERDQEDESGGGGTISESVSWDSLTEQVTSEYRPHLVHHFLAENGFLQKSICNQFYDREH